MDLYDRHLARQAAQGNRTAFGKLYDRHAPHVYHLLRRLTRETSLAEDLTQDTFVTAWQSFSSWQGRGKVSTYLCGIAVNKYRAHRRKEPESFVELLDETAASLPTQTDPLFHLTRKEAEAALERAIADLPDGCRDAFVLVRVEGWAYRDAAESLGVPLGTLQSRLARATQLLQRALTDSAERSEPCCAVTKP